MPQRKTQRFPYPVTCCFIVGPLLLPLFLTQSLLQDSSILRTLIKIQAISDSSDFAPEKGLCDGVRGLLLRSFTAHGVKEKESMSSGTTDTLDQGQGHSAYSSASFLWEARIPCLPWDSSIETVFSRPHLYILQLKLWGFQHIQVRSSSVSSVNTKEM